MARLMDLPPEVIFLILKSYGTSSYDLSLDDLVLLPLRQLRLVCRALDALVMQHFLTISKNLEPWAYIETFFQNREFRGRCIYERVIAADKQLISGDGLIPTINKVSKYLVNMARESNGQTHTDSEKYTRALCSAAALNLETVEIKSLVNMNEAIESFVLDERDLPHVGLVAAASENNLPLIELLVSKGANVNACNRVFENPLRIALVRGNKAAANALLDNKDLTLRTESETLLTPLHYAVELAWPDTLRKLLERPDIDPNAVDARKRSPLHLAAEVGNVPIVQLLLSRDDVAVDNKDKRGMTPLAYACRERHEAVVAMVLDRCEVDINSKDANGRTPLFQALGRSRRLAQPRGIVSDTCRSAIVQLLLDRDDVDPSMPDGLLKTPLMAMMEIGMPSAIQRSIKHPNFNAASSDWHGRTLLSYAAGAGQLDMVKLLLDEGAYEVNSRDAVGQTPLMCAAQNNHLNLVKFLLDQEGVEADSKDWEGSTALAMTCDLDIVKLLAERDDVDADSAGPVGLTPFLLAAQRRKLEILDYLAGRDDVDIERQSMRGRTALQLAEGNDWEEGAALIRRRIAARNETQVDEPPEVPQPTDASENALSL